MAGETGTDWRRPLQLFVKSAASWRALPVNSVARRSLRSPCGHEWSRSYQPGIGRVANDRWNGIPFTHGPGTVASGAHLDTAGQRRHWQRRATDKAAQCLADSTTTTTALQHVHTVCNFTCLLSSRVSDHIRPTRRIGRRTDWEHGPL